MQTQPADQVNPPAVKAGVRTSELWLFVGALGALAAMVFLDDLPGWAFGGLAVAAVVAYQRGRIALKTARAEHPDCALLAQVGVLIDALPDATPADALALVNALRGLRGAPPVSQSQGGEVASRDANHGDISTPAPATLSRESGFLSTRAAAALALGSLFAALALLYLSGCAAQGEAIRSRVQSVGLNGTATYDPVTRITTGSGGVVIVLRDPRTGGLAK